MKKILSILTASCILTLSSCEDWLDKYPLAQMSPETFFSNENELQAFSNTFYTIFPGDGLYNEGYDNIDGVKSGNGFGFNFFTGLDFYIYKGLYCGVEIALNLEDQLVSNYKKVTISGGQETDDKTKQGGHDFSLNTKVQPLLRLGWRF